MSALKTVDEPVSGPTVERRQGERFVTIFRVGKVTRLSGEELCMLRNLSPGGAMAHVASPFGIDERVSIDLRFIDPVSARVAWTRDGVVGFAFAEEIDLPRVLSARSDPDQRARPPRLSVNAQAQLRVGHEAFQVVTTDISQKGAKIFVGVPLGLGLEMRLAVEGLPLVAGTVRWSAGGMAGLSFDRPYDVWELSRWAKAQRERPDPFAHLGMKPGA